MGMLITKKATIQDTLAEIIPARQELAKELKTKYGDKSLGEIKVENVFGMRFACLLNFGGVLGNM